MQQKVMKVTKSYKMLQKGYERKSYINYKMRQKLWKVTKKIQNVTHKSDDRKLREVTIKLWKVSEWELW